MNFTVIEDAVQDKAAFKAWLTRHSRFPVGTPGDDTGNPLAIYFAGLVEEDVKVIITPSGIQVYQDQNNWYAGQISGWMGYFLGSTSRYQGHILGQIALEHLP